MSDADVLRLLQKHMSIGLWRSDLESGLVFFSPPISRLFGLPEQAGPVNVAAVRAAMHPEDAPFVLELLETISREKGSAQIVLRVRSSEAEDYKYVRLVGRYRARDKDCGEIIGIGHEVPADG
ncbi:PAS domain-containing protein [Rhizobium sp. C4]|uniref:PAS domain-containing protein n=1 Tax=Rhizobium sp. C4 TaxID=1349800 RepID=UPI001E623A5F|nr:PAS domain-containing protein [Rhizobium sp. C4]MCD2173900.1 PAS domain-containing protein [Rhizobium sp. C4]